MSKMHDELVAAIYEIYVEKSLQYLIRVYEWILPKDHLLYTRFNNSFENITLSNFISIIQSYVLCNGISLPEDKFSINIMQHILVKKFDFLKYSNASEPYDKVVYLRSNSCYLLIENTGVENVICDSCEKYQIKTIAEKNWKDKKMLQPIKPKAPITLTSPDRLKVSSD